MSLNNITYPYFQANQLLTNTHLNNLVDYVDQEVRNSRVFLNGIGIHYGLEVDVDIDIDNQNSQPDNQSPVTIRIKEGVGVTSKGFIFKIDRQGTSENQEAACEFSYYNPNDPNLTELQVRDFFNINENDKCSDLVNPVAAWSLSNNDAGTERLTLADLHDKTLVFFCKNQSLKPENNNSGGCVNSLSVNSQDYAIIQMVLLLDEPNLNLILNIDEEGEGADGIETYKPIPIRRFGVKKNPNASPVERYPYFTDFSEIDTIRKFLQAYDDVITSTGIGNIPVAATIQNAYTSAARTYKKIFGDKGNVFNNLYDKLDSLKNGLVSDIINSNPLLALRNVQYFHAFLRDLALAYDDFACLEVVQQAAGFPRLCSFPKFLMLGKFEVDVEFGLQIKGKPFRHERQELPVKDLETIGFDDAKVYFERMEKLVATNDNDQFINLHFPFQEDSEYIQITPSNRQHDRLGERAIPYYINSAILRPCWNSALKSQIKQARIPSYYNDIVSNNDLTVKHHSFFEFNRFDFYRVEGHIGKTVNQVKGQIERERAVLNLPFDIRIVKIKRDGNDNDGLQNKTLEDLELLYDKIVGDLKCDLDLIDTSGASFLETSIGLLKNALKSNLSEFYNSNMVVNGQVRPELEEIFDLVFSNNPEKKYHLDLIKDLIKTYQDQIDTIESMRWFEKFATKHPGLEHLGGVYRGGTLVLVCSNLNPEGEPVVVADFCLPYVCCSDSPAINYQVVNITPQIFMEDHYCVDINAEPLERFNISATPGGGELTVEGGEAQVGNVIDGSGPYQFVPGNFSQLANSNGGEINIIYTIQGFSVVKTVTVEKEPEIEIEVVEKNFIYEKVLNANNEEVCILVSVIVNLNASISELARYRWTSADGTEISQTSSASISIDILEETQLPQLQEIVTLAVETANGCRNSVEKTITACPDEIKLTVDFFEEGNNILIKVDRFNGQFLLEKEVTDEDGNQSFQSMSSEFITEFLQNVPTESCNTEVYSSKTAPLIENFGGGVYRLSYQLKNCDISTFQIFELPSFEELGSPVKASAKKKTNPSKKSTELVKNKALSSSKVDNTNFQFDSKLLNKRLSSQKELLNNFEKTKKLGGKTIGIAIAFAGFNSSDASALNTRYDEAAKAVSRRVSATKDEKQKNWRVVSETLFFNYLDKLSINSPNELDENAVKTIQESLSKMTVLDFKPTELLENWNTKALNKAIINAPAITEIENLIKQASK